MKVRQMKSNLEDRLYEAMLDIGLRPVREYKFHPTRKWRADFAFVTEGIIIEVEGGIWSGGRHVRPLGFENDADKYNAAVLRGWDVYRIYPRMIRNGSVGAISLIKKALEKKGVIIP